MAIADQNADNPHSFRPPPTALPHLTSPSFSPFRPSRTTRAHVKAPQLSSVGTGMLAGGTSLAGVFAALALLFG